MTTRAVSEQQAVACFLRGGLAAVAFQSLGWLPALARRPRGVGHLLMGLGLREGQARVQTPRTKCLCS